MKHFVVGLTGGIGAGKSTVSDIFANLGADVVDADAVTRGIWQSDLLFIDRIRDHFGSGVISTDGAVNRRAIRDIVFSDRTELEFLECLLHPRIRSALLEFAENSQKDYVIMVIPLLFEKGYECYVSRTMCVDLLPELQVERASTRDMSAPHEIRQIMKSQMSREERRRRSDDIIYNDGNIQEKYRIVKLFHDFYMRQAEKSRNDCQMSYLQKTC